MSDSRVRVRDRDAISQDYGSTTLHRHDIFNLTTSYVRIVTNRLLSFQGYDLTNTVCL